jgi:hypothetical protein
MRKDGGRSSQKISINLYQNTRCYIQGGGIHQEMECEKMHKNRKKEGGKSRGERKIASIKHG